MRNVPEPELIEIEKHYRKRTRLTTDKLPEDLPVEVVDHDLPEGERVCPECGGELHVMGRDSRRELVIIPAQVKIREHIRLVYACCDCEKDECGVPVLKSHEPDKLAQRKSYMWLYRTRGDTKDAIILHDYQPDRKTKRPAEFLKGFKGYLHTDGYESYHSLGSGITVIGC